MALADVRLTVAGDFAPFDADLKRAFARANAATGRGFRATGAEQALGRITGKADEFTKSLEASNARVIAFGASAGTIFALRRAFEVLISSTIEVQKNLTDINTLLGLSSNSLRKFGNELFDVASSTGTAFADASKTANEFARQGLSVAETLRRTKDALVLNRLSALGFEESVNSLTASVNAFRSEALTTTDVVNRLATVDARFAVSAGDLAEGLRRAASSAEDANVTFNETIALVTAAQQITARGGAVIGNAFKTIFTRLQRPQVLQELENVGIAVRDTAGKVLPLTSVLRNLAGAYDTLSDGQRSFITEQVASVFQINILKATLGDLGSSYSIYTDALRTAERATDAADKRNEQLNTTLSSKLIKTLNNVQKVASGIGEISIAPALGGGLASIDSFLGAVGKVSTSENAGAELGRGLFRGIGNFLTGPALQGIGVLALKLFARLGKFAVDSFSEFTNLNRSAKELSAIQAGLNSYISQQPGLLNRIYEGSVKIENVQQDYIKALREENSLLAFQAKTIKEISLGVRGSGIKSESYTVGKVTARFAGHIPSHSGGYIPDSTARQERMGAASAGYTAGVIKSMQVPNLGMVVYNSAEKVTNIPGASGPLISPPKHSKAAPKHRAEAIAKLGVDPYAMAAGGRVPNFAPKRISGLRKTDGGKLLPKYFDTKNVYDLYENVEINRKNLPLSVGEYRSYASDILNNARKIENTPGKSGKGISGIKETLYKGEQLGDFINRRFDSRSIKDKRKKQSDGNVSNIQGALAEIDSYKLLGTELPSGFSIRKLLNLEGADFAVSGPDGRVSFLAESKARKAKTSEDEIAAKALVYEGSKGNYKQGKQDLVRTAPIEVLTAGRASDGYVPNLASWFLDRDVLKEKYGNTGSVANDVFTQILNRAKSQNAIEETIVGPAGIGKTTLAASRGAKPISSLSQFKESDSLTIIRAFPKFKANLRDDQLEENELETKSLFDSTKRITLLSGDEDSVDRLRLRRAKTGVNQFGRTGKIAGPISNPIFEAELSEAYGDKLSVIQVTAGKNGKVEHVKRPSIGAPIGLGNVAFSSGAYTPFTAGHEFLVNQARAFSKQNKIPQVISVSQGINREADLGLTIGQKAALIERIYPEANIVKSGEGVAQDSVFEAIGGPNKGKVIKISRKGSTVFLGDERGATDVGAKGSHVPQYTKAGYNIQSVIGGNADDPTKRITSGTDVRKAIINKDKEQLRKLLPTETQDILVGQIEKLYRRGALISQRREKAHKEYARASEERYAFLQQYGERGGAEERSNNPKVAEKREFYAKKLSELKYKTQNASASEKVFERLGLGFSTSGPISDYSGNRPSPDFIASREVIGLREFINQKKGVTSPGIEQPKIYDTSGVTKEQTESLKARVLQEAASKGRLVRDFERDINQQVTGSSLLARGIAPPEVIQSLFPAWREKKSEKTAEIRASTKQAKSNLPRLDVLTGDYLQTPDISKPGITGYGFKSAEASEEMRRVILENLKRTMKEATVAAVTAAGFSSQIDKLRIPDLAEVPLGPAMGAITELVMRSFADYATQATNAPIDLPKGIRPEFAAMFGIKPGVPTEVKGTFAAAESPAIFAKMARAASLSQEEVIEAHRLKFLKDEEKDSALAMLENLKKVNSSGIKRPKIQRTVPAAGGLVPNLNAFYDDAQMQEILANLGHTSGISLPIARRNPLQIKAAAAMANKMGVQDPMEYLLNNDAFKVGFARHVPHGADGFVPNLMDTSLLRAFRATKKSLSRGQFDFSDLSEYDEAFAQKGMKGRSGAIFDPKTKKITLHNDLASQNTDRLIQTLTHEGIHKFLNLADGKDSSSNSLRGRLVSSSINFNASESKENKKAIDTSLRTMVSDYPSGEFLEEALADGSLRKPGEARILNNYLELTNRQIRTSNKLYYRLRKSAYAGLKTKGLAAGGAVPKMAASALLKFSETRKPDEDGLYYIKAKTQAGDAAGQLEYSINDGMMEIEMTSASKKGMGYGKMLYQRASEIAKAKGLGIKSTLTPQLDNLANLRPGGNPVAALFPQLSRAEGAKSAYFEQYSRGQLDVSKLNIEEFKKQIGSAIKNPATLSGFLKENNYDLITSYSQGLVPYDNRSTGARRFDAISEFLSGKVSKPLTTLSKNDFIDAIAYLEGSSKEGLNQDLRVGGFGGAFPFGRKKTGSVARLLKKNKFGFNANNGLVPNLNAVQDAVSREVSAGYSMSQVRVGSDPRLKTSFNPGGFGVYNTTEGSLSGAIGIHRNMGKSMSDVRVAGAAQGSVPNFAPPISSELVDTYGISNNVTATLGLALLSAGQSAEEFTNKLSSATRRVGAGKLADFISGPLGEIQRNLEAANKKLSASELNLSIKRNSGASASVIRQQEAVVIDDTNARNRIERQSETRRSDLQRQSQALFTASSVLNVAAPLATSLSRVLGGSDQLGLSIGNFVQTMGIATQVAATLPPTLRRAGLIVGTVIAGLNLYKTAVAEGPGLIKQFDKLKESTDKVLEGLDSFARISFELANLSANLSAPLSRQVELTKQRNQILAKLSTSDSGADLTKIFSARTPKDQQEAAGSIASRLRADLLAAETLKNIGIQRDTAKQDNRAFGVIPVSPLLGGGQKFVDEYSTFYGTTEASSRLGQATVNNASSQLAGLFDDKDLVRFASLRGKGEDFLLKVIAERGTEAQKELAKNKIISDNLFVQLQSINNKRVAAENAFNEQGPLDRAAKVQKAQDTGKALLKRRDELQTSISGARPVFDQRISGQQGLAQLIRSQSAATIKLQGAISLLDFTNTEGGKIRTSGSAARAEVESTFARNKAQIDTEVRGNLLKAIEASVSASTSGQGAGEGATTTPALAQKAALKLEELFVRIQPETNKPIFDSPRDFLKLQSTNSNGLLNKFFKETNKDGSTKLRTDVLNTVTDFLSTGFSPDKIEGIKRDATEKQLEESNRRLEGIQKANLEQINQLRVLGKQQNINFGGGADVLFDRTKSRDSQREFAKFSRLSQSKDPVRSTQGFIGLAASLERDLGSKFSGSVSDALRKGALPGADKAVAKDIDNKISALERSKKIKGADVGSINVLIGALKSRRGDSSGIAKDIIESSIKKEQTPQKQLDELKRANNNLSLLGDILNPMAADIKLYVAKATEPGSIYTNDSKGREILGSILAKISSSGGAVSKEGTVAVSDATTKDRAAAAILKQKTYEEDIAKAKTKLDVTPSQNAFSEFATSSGGQSAIMAAVGVGIGTLIAINIKRGLTSILSKALGAGGVQKTVGSTVGASASGSVGGGGALSGLADAALTLYTLKDVVKGSRGIAGAALGKAGGILSKGKSFLGRDISSFLPSRKIAPPNIDEYTRTATGAYKKTGIVDGFVRKSKGGFGTRVAYEPLVRRAGIGAIQGPGQEIYGKAGQDALLKQRAAPSLTSRFLKSPKGILTTSGLGLAVIGASALAYYDQVTTVIQDQDKELVSIANSAAQKIPKSTGLTSSKLNALYAKKAQLDSQSQDLALEGQFGTLDNLTGGLSKGQFAGFDLTGNESARAKKQAEISKERANINKQIAAEKVAVFTKEDAAQKYNTRANSAANYRIDERGIPVQTPQGAYNTFLNSPDRVQEYKNLKEQIELGNKNSTRPGQSNVDAKEYTLGKTLEANKTAIPQSSVKLEASAENLVSATEEFKKVVEKLVEFNLTSNDGQKLVSSTMNLNIQGAKAGDEKVHKELADLVAKTVRVELAKINGAPLPPTA